MNKKISSNLKKFSFIPQVYLPKLKGEKLLDVASEKSELSLLSFKPKKIFGKIVCLHALDDNSQAKVLKKFESKANIEFLSYDEIDTTWTFSFEKARLLFHLGNYTIEPIGIYNRPHVPEESHAKFESCFNLVQAIQVWGGKKVDCNPTHLYNSSKALQLVTTIKAGIANDKENPVIQIPESFFIKGSAEKLRSLLGSYQSLIVKSCSGIRSKVVDEKIFSSWDWDNLKHLPTFFQKHIKGNDIRIHCLNKDKCWSVTVYEKDSVDYRYAKKTSGFDQYLVGENIVTFCQFLSKLEKVDLSGIDLIKDESMDRYVCLECNPNPGWAGFHRNAGDELNLAESILNYLSGSGDGGQV